MIHFRIRFEDLRDRLVSVRRRAAILRMLWVGLAVAAGALLTRVAVDRLDVAVPVWPWLLLAIAAAWRPLRNMTSLPPDRQLARALDRRFGSGELLVTAVEVDARGVQGTVEARVLDDAATLLARLGGARAIAGRRLRVEAEAVAAAAMIVAGLMMAGGWLRGLPELPGPAAAGSGAGAGAGAAAPQAGAGEAQAALSGLGEALGDQAVAQAAVAAMRRGDAGGAARALRDLAADAPRLSAAGRQSLADALSDAARRPGVPSDLAERAAAASWGLREPSAEAPMSLERLADAVERAAPPGAGSLAPGAPRQRSGAAIDGAAGDPWALPTAEGLSPAEVAGGDGGGAGPASRARSSDSNSGRVAGSEGASGADGGGGGGELNADDMLLRDLRERAIVRDYLSDLRAEEGAP